MKEGRKLSGKMKTGLLIAIIAAAGVTTTLLIVFNMPPGTTPSYSKKISFMEIQASGSPEEQFIELYAWEGVDSTLQGWIVECETRNFTLPAISNLGMMTYIVLNFSAGTWTDDTDASDKVVMLYYDVQGLEPMHDVEGNLTLFDDEGRVVDYVHWGGIAPAAPLGNWPSTDGGMLATPDPSLSMQMWGDDLDNSTNWYENMSTPRGANAFEFTVSTVNGPRVVKVFNGINYDLPDGPEENYTLVGKVVISGNPANWTTKKQIEEMVNYTLDYYAKLGLPAPYAGPDGVIDIHLAKGNDTETCGGTYRSGKIVIDVGTVGGFAGNVSLKNCVEHELMHGVQAQIGPGGGYDRWPKTGPNGDLSFAEGMAVWGGITSTMGNFNLNWSEVMVWLWLVDDHNWYDHYRDLNRQMWPFGGKYDDYIGMGLFVKFLNETYGTNKLVNIFKRIKNYFNGTTGQDVNATTAIAQELSPLTFPDVWRAYQEWLVNGSATKSNGFPALDPGSTVTPPAGPGTTVLDGPTTVQPWGSHVEFINTTGVTQPFKMSFNPGNGSTWKITIIYTFPDGSKMSHVFDMPEEQWAVIQITNASVWSNITIIKTRIGNEGTGTISMNLTGYTPATTMEDLWRLVTGTIGPHYAGYLEAGQTLNVTMANATNPGSDMFIGFEMFALNGTFLNESDNFSPTDPKEAMFYASEGTYFIISSFWLEGVAGEPFPTSEDVRIDTTITIT